jgi:hypothetical protein
VSGQEGYGQPNLVGIDSAQEVGDEPPLVETGGRGFQPPPQHSEFGEGGHTLILGIPDGDASL